MSLVTRDCMISGFLSFSFIGSDDFLLQVRFSMLNCAPKHFPLCHNTVECWGAPETSAL